MISSATGEGVLAIRPDKGRGTFVYQQIAEGLRAVLKRGLMPAGTMLPPERVLCERYGVSRMTLRQAFDVLLAEPSLGRVWLIRAGSTVVGYVVLTLVYSMEYGGPAAVVSERQLLVTGGASGKGAAPTRVDAYDLGELGVLRDVLVRGYGDSLGAVVDSVFGTNAAVRPPGVAAAV